jgi:hypothetical protein
MRGITSVLGSLACVLTSIAITDEPSGQFQGEWRTTIGLVKLDQQGDTVTGT